MVTQGKARQGKGRGGNQRWLWGDLPASACLVYLHHIQNTADTQSCRNLKSSLFFTHSCFPSVFQQRKLQASKKFSILKPILFFLNSISCNLGLAASHSSPGEMTSLIERPTTSTETSVTSGDINRDICNISASTIELSRPSWQCTSRIKCWC